MLVVALWRLAILGCPVAIVEVLCRLGWIDRITLPAPSIIAEDLVRLLASGRVNAALAKTLTHVAMALAASLVAGVAAGVLVHRLPPLRRALEPLFATYYAIPIYAFYPLLIVVFGLGDAPQVLIGFMLAVVAVIVSTLSGLDSVPRVMTKTARVHRMGPAATALHVTLPYALPYLFTGAKLAVADAFIGVIGAEFIMSQAGVGFEIRFAFDNFDNATMYPLILLVLLFAVVLNLGLDRWERALMARRGRV
jgi:NitT/TauT family transport system permease protein